MIARERRSRIYTAWNNMRQRCFNKSRRDYVWYGARGITVCPEWVNSFPNFLKWALENGYDDHLTLDRIETNGHYCPENCRWASRKDQANNRRSSRYLTMGGRTQSLQQWADELNVDKCTIWRRLANGWSVERALTEPVHIEKSPRRLMS